VDDAGAARLLRVPDLADRRELDLGGQDRRAARVAEARGKSRQPRRERRRDGDLVRVGVDERRERGARGLGALDPVLPRRAVLVPVAEVVVVGLPHRVGERTL
jgi:hypothetical protein